MYNKKYVGQIMWYAIKNLAQAIRFRSFYFKSKLDFI